ncbi:TniB family NTP-binding protein, partial [Embleya sp. NPDC127516]|uniref:TniB family NTP-binding protein n=1 Tax=Embleya sp. NPDC127516 TaxID=3363990 RepID=UPI003813B173
ILGRHQRITARPALIVTGPAAAGKTTALLHVGRACHLAHARRVPAPPGQAHPRVPVAYVLVPPGATAKALAGEFARYLGVPAGARMTLAQITEAVCHTYHRAGVHLVLIDEIHRLNPRTTTGAETADLLKDLTERIGATFVYAGIDVTATPLFGGVRGAQLAGRASLVECGAFPARLGKREPFKELIAGVEAALDPKRTPRGDTTAASRPTSTNAPPAGSAAPSRLTRLIRLIRLAAITDRRRHRTHHQNQPRPDPPRPHRRNPTPRPARRPLRPGRHRPGLRTAGPGPDVAAPARPVPGRTTHLSRTHGLAR